MSVTQQLPNPSAGLHKMGLASRDNAIIEPLDREAETFIGATSMIHICTFYEPQTQW